MEDLKQVTNIPRQLRSLIPVRKILEVEDWWEKLSEENQLELQSIYDEGDERTEELVAIHLCGKFVEQEKEDRLDIFWINHFYEYIINHEMFIEDNRPAWYGRICSANKEAEQVIRNGILPKEFICPESKKDCLMLKILDIHQRKKSLQFYVKFKLEKDKK